MTYAFYINIYNRESDEWMNSPVLRHNIYAPINVRYINTEKAHLKRDKKKKFKRDIFIAHFASEFIAVQTM